MKKELEITDSVNKYGADLEKTWYRDLETEKSGDYRSGNMI